jgi:integrase/recombinase XerD
VPTPSAVGLTDHAAMSTPHLNVVARHPHAAAWLRLQADLGLAVRTLDAYSRGLAGFLSLCEREQIEPVGAGRAEIARYLRHLVEQPSGRPSRSLDRGQPDGLANATIQQRLTVVRLFYDYLVEEGLRRTNPVGRGRYTSRKGFGGRRGLVQRLTKLPWIPTQDEWRAVLEVARRQPVRNRVMFALAYDGGLRREELCSLRTDDLDPAHRTIRIRPETTKTRAGRVVPYSAPTGVLLQAYLVHRRTLSLTRGPLFLSESHRNTAKPISLWTWSKVVRGVTGGAVCTRNGSAR